MADYHYEQSRFIVVDVSDPDVLALLDEPKDGEPRLHIIAAPQQEMKP